MHRKMDMICFSGTGNTEKIVTRVAEHLTRNEINVEKKEIGSKYTPEVNGELLLAFPVNAQAVSPYIWKYFKAMPEGKGTKVHVVVTMNESAVILSPLKKMLLKKGYVPQGAVEISMPNNLVMGEDTTAERWKDALVSADQFAEAIVRDTEAWNETKKGSVFVSALSRRTVLPWFGMRLFNKLVTDSEKCIQCGKCVKECPVQNIKMANGIPTHKGNCQFCMHCGAVCPNDAVRVKGRPQCYIRNASQVEKELDEGK